MKNEAQMCRESVPSFGAMEDLTPYYLFLWEKECLGLHAQNAPFELTFLPALSLPLLPSMWRESPLLLLHGGKARCYRSHGQGQQMKAARSNPAQMTLIWNKGIAIRKPSSWLLLQEVCSTASPLYSESVSSFMGFSDKEMLGSLINVFLCLSFWALHSWPLLCSQVARKLFPSL